MRARRQRAILAAVLAGLALTGCAGDSAGETQASDDGGGPTIVATTSILGDITRNVVGDAGTVETLMDAGTDPHAYEVSAADARMLREADLVVANGLDLEASVLDALEAAAGEGVEVLHVAEAVDPIPFGDDAAHADEEEHASEAEDEHGHGELDPHFWLDPQRVAEAVTVIGDAVAEAAPAAADAVESNAAAYREQVLALDAELEDAFSAIPDDRRAIVTNHDAFGYLAQRYGFEVVGTVIPGGSTLAEPSARELEELAHTIEEAGVPAIFTENVAPPRVAETVSREVGRDIEVVALYSDALGEPGSQAATYLDLMRTNAERIVDALAE